MKKFLGLLACTVLITFTASGPALAGLPPEVNGKPLPSLAPMLQKVIPGVVNISTEGKVQVRDPFFDDPLLRRFFNLPDQPRTEQIHSLGSGVIVDAKKGYVLTNNHVIARADKITVLLQDGRRFNAKLIGTDPQSDVAVVQIPAEHLTAVPMADSAHLRVGDFVVAIGNPFGLGQTVTSGIVSALGRSGLGIEGYEDFIQTDASINPGNSGGALVNLRGQLVGINTAILSRSGGNIGIGFAIPINMARQVMEQLIKHGRVRRGLLGVHAQNLTPALAQAFGIRQTKGAVITRVTPDSPAAKAGLEAGDVIVGVNGTPVPNASTLRTRIGLLSVGDRVRLDVMRNGRTLSVTAVIAQSKVTKLDAGSVDRRLQGITLGNIPEGSPLYGHVEGVMVLKSHQGSPAWQAGLRDHDVIVSINRNRVRNLQQFKQAMASAQNALLINIRRGDTALFLILR
jgi:Do/DeqQ family serine protease